MRDTIFNGLLKQSSQNTPLSNFSVSSHSCLLFYKRKITPNICRALCRSEHVVIMFLFWTTCTWTLALFIKTQWAHAHEKSCLSLWIWKAIILLIRIAMNSFVRVFQSSTFMEPECIIDIKTYKLRDQVWIWSSGVLGWISSLQKRKEFQDLHLFVHIGGLLIWNWLWKLAMSLD